MVRLLLTVRAIPFLFRRRLPQTRPLRFARGVGSLTGAGFGLLAEQPDREVVLGLAGLFWQLRPRIKPLEMEAARAGPPPGSAHAGWNFSIHPFAAGTTLLSTETRVLTGDRASRRPFRSYWLLVRPFSGVLRRAMLRAVTREAVRLHTTATPIDSRE